MFLEARDRLQAELAAPVVLAGVQQLALVGIEGEVSLVALRSDDILPVDGGGDVGSRGKGRARRFGLGSDGRRGGHDLLHDGRRRHGQIGLLHIDGRLAREVASLEGIVVVARELALVVAPIALTLLDGAGVAGDGLIGRELEHGLIGIGLLGTVASEGGFLRLGGHPAAADIAFGDIERVVRRDGANGFGSRRRSRCARRGARLGARGRGFGVAVTLRVNRRDDDHRHRENERQRKRGIKHQLRCGQILKKRHAYPSLRRRNICARAHDTPDTGIVSHTRAYCKLFLFGIKAMKKAPRDRARRRAPR